MIYIKLEGRLGNILFKIATIATHAKRTGYDWACLCHKDYKLAPPDNCYIIDYVKKFQNTIFKGVKFVESVPIDVYHWDKPTYCYQPIPNRDNMLITGGFFDSRYMDEDVVQSLFACDATYKEIIDKILPPPNL